MERYTNKIRPTVLFVQLGRKDISLPVVSGYEGRLVYLSVYFEMSLWINTRVCHSRMIII